MTPGVPEAAQRTVLARFAGMERFRCVWSASGTPPISQGNAMIRWIALTKKNHEASFRNAAAAALVATKGGKVTKMVDYAAYQKALKEIAALKVALDACESGKPIVPSDRPVDE